MTDAERLVLNRQVAERVMGWDHTHDIHECEDPWYAYCRTCGLSGSDLGVRAWDATPCAMPPDYAGDIRAAWTVLAVMIARLPTEVGLQTQLEVSYQAHGQVWYCHLPHGRGQLAETAPEAICRAALAVVGVAVPA